MTQDFTTQIVALQRAKVDMQAEKATNKITVKARYAERIRQEVQDANEAAELRFARMLADAVEAGIPQAVIRRDVLRTNAWDRWTYWRDLAGIQPERVILRDAKAEAKAAAERETATFNWEGGVLTWLRNVTTGEALPQPLVIAQFSPRGWWLESTGVGMFQVRNSTASGSESNALRKAIRAEVARAVEAGEVVSNDPADLPGDYDPDRYQEAMTAGEEAFRAVNPELPDRDDA